MASQAAIVASIMLYKNKPEEVAPVIGSIVCARSGGMPEVARFGRTFATYEEVASVLGSVIFARTGGMPEVAQFGR